MAASCRSKIVMRGDSGPDAGARVTNRDLEVMAEMSAVSAFETA
jgi:hypothetical protein